MFFSAYNKIGGSMDLKRLQNILENRYRYDLIPIFLKEENTTLEKIEEELIQSKNIPLIYLFARYSNSSSKEKLAQIVLNSHSLYYICEFAVYIPNVLTCELAKEIVHSKNPQYILYFSLFVLHAPISLLQKAILEIQNPKYLYLYARLVKESDKTLLEKAIIARQNVEFIYLFLQDIHASNELIRALIQSKNSVYIAWYLYHRYQFPFPDLKEVIASFKDEIFSYPYDLFLQVTIEHCFYSNTFKTLDYQKRLALLKTWIEKNEFDLITCYGKKLLEKNIQKVNFAKQDKQYQKLFLKKIQNDEF